MCTYVVVLGDKQYECWMFVECEGVVVASCRSMDVSTVDDEAGWLLVAGFWLL